MGVNWVSLSYSWTTIYSNSCVFLGAAAVNTNQIMDDLAFATTKKGK